MNACACKHVKHSTAGMHEPVSNTLHTQEPAAAPASSTLQKREYVQAVKSKQIAMQVAALAMIRDGTRTPAMLPSFSIKLEQAAGQLRQATGPARAMWQYPRKEPSS